MKKLFKKNHNKVGILGGTFDPPHIGHLHVSKIAIKKLRLDNVIWLITKQNPLKKKPYLNTDLRIKLSQDITKNQKKISVEYIDNLVKSKNTFNLLNYVKNKTKADLFFLMGADNLKKFHKWKNWKQIPKLAKIVVFPRKKHSYDSIATKKLNKKDLIYINVKKINISSSLIRKFM